jgi:hypothetical protein
MVLTPTGSPIQFHAPTQRVEERKCVPHDCGAVRMCAFHGLEQGGRTETLLQTLKGLQRAPSLGDQRLIRLIARKGVPVNG